MKPENKVYGIITDKIIELMEQGTIPWTQKWDSQLPQNFVTKRQYTGFNFFYLYVMALQKGYKSPYWMTFHQIQSIKGKLKSGQYKNGEIVIFYKMNPWLDKNDLDKDGQPKKKMYPMLRFYTVYNVEQTEGIEYESGTRQNNGIETCETIVKEYKDHPPIVNVNGQTPCYIPSEDRINIPEMNTYEKAEYYYRSLFHEFTHSTGHEKRLARFDSKDNKVSFTEEARSKEELTAELGAAFLCAEASISNEDMQKYNAAYIKSWLQVLKDDKRMVIEAASKAQRAVDHIRGIERIAS